MFLITRTTLSNRDDNIMIALPLKIAFNQWMISELKLNSNMLRILGAEKKEK
jgi:hypothetical protein